MLVVSTQVQDGQHGDDGRLQRRVERPELARDLGPHAGGFVAVIDLEVGLEQLDDREVRRGLAVRDGPGLEDEPVARMMGVRELPEHPGLSQTGLAHERHDLTLSGRRARKGGRQQLHLGLAADETGEPAERGYLKPCPRVADPDDLVNLHRLDTHRTERSRLDVSRREPARLSGHQDAARLGRLLHAGRQVRRLTDRRVVHVEIAADRPHDDFAGVEADADPHGGAVGVSGERVGVSPSRLLHPESRQARPYRVVLEGDGSTEEGHDSVAHHLVDRAFVLVNGIHHQLEHGVENRPRFFGVAVGQQFHRPFQVGEQHRHLLALALERAPGGEDLLGEVLRGVSVGRAEPRRRRAGDLGERTSSYRVRRRWRPGERGAAAAAELLTGFVRETARLAGRSKRGAALGAEPASIAVLCRALEAFHTDVSAGGGVRIEPGADRVNSQETTLKTPDLRAIVPVLFQ